MPDRLRLYLIRRARESVGYDEAAGFVIAAASVGHALTLIREATAEYPNVTGAGGEGTAAWLTAPVLELGYAKPGLKPGILLRDFKAG